MENPEICHSSLECESESLPFLEDTERAQGFVETGSVTLKAHTPWWKRVLVIALTLTINIIVTLIVLKTHNALYNACTHDFSPAFYCKPRLTALISLLVTVLTSSQLQPRMPLNGNGAR